MADEYEFQIDDDVSPPADGLIPSGGKRKYPFPDLQVGQSFFVPHRPATKMSSAITNAQKRMPGRRFMVRSVTEEFPKHSGIMVKGCRIWRNPDRVERAAGKTPWQRDEQPTEE
jgi:hypothetical protein